MITLFSEQDLVSFGNFMISQDRLNLYLSDPSIKPRLNEYITQVNIADLEEWARIESSKRSQPIKSESELNSEENIDECQK